MKTNTNTMHDDCYQPPSRWSTALMLAAWCIIAAGLLYLALAAAGSR